MNREVWVLEQVEPKREQKYVGSLPELVGIIKNKVIGGDVGERKIT
jgi:hypothetical protein